MLQRSFNCVVEDQLRRRFGFSSDKGSNVCIAQIVGTRNLILVKSLLPYRRSLIVVKSTLYASLNLQRIDIFSFNHFDGLKRISVYRGYEVRGSIQVQPLLDNSLRRFLLV